MWFRNVFLKTLRDYRVAIIGWGVGMGLVIVSPMASVAALISTPAQHAALASLAAQFAWNADPIKADTVGGYATFKIGVFVFIACIWPLLAASRMLRGEEDRGSLDVLLSAPRTRLSIALQKVAAMWTALLVIGLVSGVIAYIGGLAFKADLTLADGLMWGPPARPGHCCSSSSSSTWCTGLFPAPIGFPVCRRSTTTTSASP